MSTNQTAELAGYNPFRESLTSSDSTLVQPESVANDVKEQHRLLRYDPTNPFLPLPTSDPHARTRIAVGSPMVQARLDDHQYPMVLKTSKLTNDNQATKSQNLDRIYTRAGDLTSIVATGTDRLGDRGGQLNSIQTRTEQFDHDADQLRFDAQVARTKLRRRQLTLRVIVAIVAMTLLGTLICTNFAPFLVSHLNHLPHLVAITIPLKRSMRPEPTDDNSGTLPDASIPNDNIDNP